MEKIVEINGDSYAPKDQPHRANEQGHNCPLKYDFINYCKWVYIFAYIKNVFINCSKKPKLKHQE